ncbi:MAG: helix-turn-helix transcriptional regulator [Eubacterium sp.]|nr:helix-turn-helix transcriptional regulator [Eubacterium sp.]
MRISTKFIWNFTFINPKHAGIDVVQTGQKMKKICSTHGLTVKMIQEQLYLGTFQSVYAWFSGKSLPSLDNIYRLSQILNVPIDHMVVGAGVRYEADLWPEDIPSDGTIMTMRIYYNVWKPMFPYFQNI